MSIYEQAFGNAYAGDPEFDNLSGYCTAEYSYTWYDAGRNAYIRTTLTHINLGRAAGVVPRDVDEQMQAENLSDYGYNKDFIKPKLLERHARLEADVIRYLVSHGPSHVKIIASDLGLKRITLLDFMNKRANTVFARVGRCGVAVLWGVRGIHEETSKNGKF